MGSRRYRARFRPSGACAVATSALKAVRRRGGSAPARFAVVCDALALIGVVAGSVPLFMHGWVHVTVLLTPGNSSGSGLRQRLGAEVDKQIAAIVAHEIAAAIAPTLWRYPGHAFQALFALLLLIGAVTLAAPALPRRGRIVARAGASLGIAAAAAIVAAAFLRIDARIAGLPARIADAMQRNALVRQSFAATGSTPHVSGGLGWPLIVVAVGVGLASIGALAGLILAFRSGGRNEGAIGEPRGAAAVPNDGSAPDAYRDARTV